LVMGAGPIGLGVAQFARMGGAKVIVMDTNDDRLLFSTSFVDDVMILNPLRGDAFAQLSEMTNGDMPTIVMDATGNRAAINNAFSYLSHGGVYVLVGLQMGDVSFSHPGFHKREATLMSSRNATKTDFDWVLQAIENKSFDPLKMISHRIGFTDLKDRFGDLTKPGEKTIKVLVEF